MIWAKRVFPDGKGLENERLSFRQPVCCHEQSREVVEITGDVGVREFKREKINGKGS